MYNQYINHNHNYNGQFNAVRDFPRERALPYRPSRENSPYRKGYSPSRSP